MSYCMKTAFLTALSTVGAENVIYTYDDIWNFLMKFIMENRHLIVCHNPFIVKTEGTSLDRAFGVKQFSYDEARNLIHRAIVPVDTPYTPKKSSLCPGNCRMSCYFAKPVSPVADSSSDSAISLQGYETEYIEDEEDICEDSSVDEYEPLIEEREPSGAEYEPISDDEIEVTVYDSQSDAASFCENIVIMGDSEALSEFFADESDTLDDDESSTYSNEDEKGKGKCIKCGLTNIDYVKYCKMCWQERKEGFGSRPVKRKRKRRMSKKEKKNIKKYSNSPESPRPLGFTKSSSEDSGINGTQETDCLSQNTNATDIEIENFSSQGYSSEMNRNYSESQGYFSVPGRNMSQEFPSSSQGYSSSQDTNQVFRKSREVDVLVISTDYVGKDKSSMKRERSESPGANFTAKSKKVFGPEDLENISIKFRKFVSTCSGRKYLKSSRFSNLKIHLDDVSSESENEKIKLKFRKFSRRYVGRQWLQSYCGSDFLSDMNKVISSDSEDESNDKLCSKLCTICYVRTANASIVHGNMAHMGYCYSCAKRLESRKSRCPACRRKIQKVTKNCYA